MGYNPRCKNCGTETIYLGNLGEYSIYICPKCGKKIKIKNL